MRRCTLAVIGVMWAIPCLAQGDGGGFGMVVSAGADDGVPFVAEGSVYVEVSEDGHAKLQVTLNGPASGSEVLSARFFKGGSEVGRCRDHYLARMAMFRTATVELASKEAFLTEAGRYQLKFFYKDKEIYGTTLTLEQIGERDVYVDGKPAKVPILREARGKRLGQSWLDMKSFPQSAAVIVNLAGKKDGKAKVNTVWRRGKKVMAAEERIVEMKKGTIQRYVCRGIEPGNNQQVPEPDLSADDVLAEEIGGSPFDPQDGLKWLDTDVIKKRKGKWTVVVSVDGEKRRVLEWKMSKKKQVELIGAQKKGKIQTPFFLVETKVVKP